MAGDVSEYFFSEQLVKIALRPVMATVCTHREHSSPGRHDIAGLGAVYQVEVDVAQPEPGQLGLEGQRHGALGVRPRPPRALLPRQLGGDKEFGARQPGCEHLPQPG